VFFRTKRVLSYNATSGRFGLPVLLASSLISRSIRHAAAGAMEFRPLRSCWSLNRKMMEKYSYVRNAANGKRLLFLTLTLCNNLGSSNRETRAATNDKNRVAFTVCSLALLFSEC
jgi:hypothetical protein